eukprot:1852760-Rhodomonas_salina.2
MLSTSINAASPSIYAASTSIYAASTSIYAASASIYGGIRVPCTQDASPKTHVLGARHSQCTHCAGLGPVRCCTRRQ